MKEPVPPNASAPFSEAPVVRLFVFKKAPDCDQREQFISMILCDMFDDPDDHEEK